MADNFDEIIKKAQQAQRPEPNVEGCFDCQQCGTSVDTGAYYNAAERLLSWECPDGHFSYIKDIAL